MPFGVVAAAIGEGIAAAAVAVGEGFAAVASGIGAAVGGIGEALGIGGAVAGMDATGLGAAAGVGAGALDGVGLAAAGGLGLDAAGTAAAGSAGALGLDAAGTAAAAGATGLDAAGTAAGAAGAAGIDATSLAPLGSAAADTAAGVGNTAGALDTLATTGSGAGYDFTGMGGINTAAGESAAGGGALSSGTTSATAAEAGTLAKAGGLKTAAGTGIRGLLRDYGPLALGALTAGAKMLGGTPKAAALPNASSVDKGPYFNAALNTNVPGRTAVNPFSSSLPTQAPAAPVVAVQQPQGQQPSPYWTYGSPEMTYFQGNALPNMGWPGNPTTQVPVQAAPNPSLPTGMARGGALARDKEFRTGSGNHRVSGPGTETSDSIPAMLSNHEYVLDAEDMRKIGGGDPVRGANRLDRDRKNLSRGRGVLAKFASERGA